MKMGMHSDLRGEKLARFERLDAVAHSKLRSHALCAPMDHLIAFHVYSHDSPPEVSGDYRCWISRASAFAGNSFCFISTYRGLMSFQ